MESGKPVLLLHHLNKGISDGDKIHLRQVRGSTAITQTARLVWAIDAPNEEDAEHRRMYVIKNNLARFAPDVGFKISESGISFTADVPRRVRTDTPTDRAREFLFAQLESGARLSSEIIEAAKELGLSKRAMDTAREALHIVTVKSPNGHWLMSLPSRRNPSEENPGF